MAINQSLHPPAEKLAGQFDTFDHYGDWQKAESVPSQKGFYVEDLAAVELYPWERKGGRGVFVNLEGTGGYNDTQLVEIAPGGKSEPERHLYEEMVYVVSGRGSTSVWYREDRKQTFEWGRGSLFAIPLNAHYQHFNGSGSEPARYMAVTNAPSIIRTFHNLDFVFNNPYAFTDRFSDDQGYFNDPGKLYKRKYNYLLQTNFVPDVHTIQLYDHAARGGGGSNIGFELAENSMAAHISEFSVGTYKKAHRHGPGAHVIILDGVGFSVLWQDGLEDHTRCDWKPGSVVVPPEDWFHQHFNTGAKPARYLALRYSGSRHPQGYNATRGERTALSLKQGGAQIEYEDEDPAIHKQFEAELAQHGATCRMKDYFSNCTGISGGFDLSGGDD